ncbi:Ig-like domain-containing protein [Microbacterium natoriense]|uniref:Ig-like domain-containing protein n=1 Tax=Microbacterium natoriense TaxID=284570 RepID=UPI0027D8F854|nr:fibronectin type III domain-containing protein [Microbacterium natoriense]
MPLDGIDADGDSVELLNISSSPTKGRITATGANYFTYEALDGSTGVDTFTYLVRDHLGKESTATIRVGIAPPEDVNQEPYAVKDAVVVRPGREIAVPVMANDSDPEGDKITLVDEENDGLEIPEIDGLSARVSGDRVLVDAPDRALETSLQYTIRDARGATASAVLQITVDEDVPLLAPVARDDRVRPEDLTGTGLTADIDILKNDEDPDGTTEGLALDLGTGARELDDGVVRVTVTDEMQLIRYTLTDRDGLEASAFIFVPAVSGLRPTLKDGTKPVQVVSGETKSLPLSEYVTIAGGGTARITEHAKVSAIHANGADLVQDETTLVYTSAAGFFGQDAVTFEVTDGTGPDDPEGRKATLTIPIDVLPPENQQPSFTGAQMEVAPGEEAIGLDLAALTDDPDPDDAGSHTFTYVSGAGSGIKAEVDGSTLRVSASSDVEKGTVSSLTLKITDGVTEPVEGTVQVMVTASTRPLPAANTDTVSEADQGKSITVPVLANDFNPFPETPLTLVSAVTESGSGGATVKGDSVVVTPSANFVGTLVVRYRIQDATKDAEREANGQVVVTVQGVPDAPGTPTITSVQDRTVVISYGAPSNNGAEITRYTVKSVKGGSYSKECTSTTCTLDGLTNNVEYTFQVTATNRVGEGKPSAASEVARPDARPDTPLPPTLAFGDRSLSVSWKTPSTPGSPVESYTLEISPVPPSGITQKQVTGNSLVWEGLENGSNYQVRVQAHNKAPEPSAWSTWSAKEVPAGPPLKPAAPTTAEIQGVGTQAQMQVSWVPPGINGDKLDALELQVWEGGTLVRTITPAADAKTQAVTVPTSETPYTYRIRAHNKAGWGDYSDASAPRRGVNRPGKPTGVTAKPTGADGQLQVAYTPGARNGAAASEIAYQYSLNGGGSWVNLPGNGVIGGLANGTDYNVTVRALATVAGTAYPGDSSDVARGNPYGPLKQPRATAAGNSTSVTLGWDGNVSANGRAITKVEISIDGGGYQTVANSGAQTVGNGHSQTHSIRVRATDAVGQTVESATASAASDPPPPPTAYITSDGDANGQDNCGDGTCAWYYVHMDNFAANTSYSVQCADYRPADGYWGSWGGPYSVTTDGNGHYEGRLGCYHGSRGYGTYQASAVINGTEYERRAWN